MNTIEIHGHSVPVTEDLEQAFWEYQAYCDLPLKVKLRRDPKCKEFQELYDSFRSAMHDAISECSTVTEDQYDDLTDRLAEEQDFLESYADQLLVVLGGEEAAE